MDLHEIRNRLDEVDNLLKSNINDEEVLELQESRERLLEAFSAWMISGLSYTSDA